MAPPSTDAGDIVVLGPLQAPAATHGELVRRALHWSDLLGYAAPANVSAGTSSAAVRTATEHLESAPPGTAAVIDLRSGQTRYVRLLGHGRMRWTGIRTLGEVSVTAAGDVHVPTDVVSRWTNPYSGLFAPVTTEPSPEHDSAVARLHIVGLPPRQSLGWALTPDHARGRALLAGARTLATRLPPSPPDGRIQVGAAGVSELHWLLDGALRLLAAHEVDSGARARADDMLDVAAYRIPHLADDWQIARAFRSSSGAPVAAAWGCDEPAAIRHAVAAARAQLAAPSTGSTWPASPPSADDMLATLSRTELARLQDDVLRCLSRLRLRPLGARLAADALLGDPGLAWGVVWQA